MPLWDHIIMGIQAVFAAEMAVSILGFGVPVVLILVTVGFILGVFVGAVPGLGAPVAMALSLPILISVFGFSNDALLPILGFLIGLMKGATVGGAVPAILYNTPGTPDSYMTTLDGHPMAQKGQAARALKIAHLSSATGDTISDVALVILAPFLAITIEHYFDFPEKTALFILSLALVAGLMGDSVGKGLISIGLGLLAVMIANGEDFYPRLSLGSPSLAQGIPVTAAILGVLVLGEVFKGLEDEYRTRSKGRQRPEVVQVDAPGKLGYFRLLPTMLRSSAIGTLIGALPGVGSTLAATLGYAAARARHDRPQTSPKFGSGVPEGVAASEAANSSVSGANLIPVLSLGIPGNVAAVFLLLAMESVGGFTPGPGIFVVPAVGINIELVMVIGIIAIMFFANALNWTLGGVIMGRARILAGIPKVVLLPIILLLTITVVYAQHTNLGSIWLTIGFGVLGYFMRCLGMSPIPFVVAFIIGLKLEDTARQAFSATGGDPFFLFSSPVAIALSLGTVIFVYFSLRRRAPS